MDTHNTQPPQPIRTGAQTRLRGTIVLQSLFALTFLALFLIGSMSAGARPTTGTVQSPLLTPTPSNTPTAGCCTDPDGRSCLPLPLGEQPVVRLYNYQQLRLFGPGERNQHS